jgi:hypothetical protein
MATKPKQENATQRLIIEAPGAGASIKPMIYEGNHCA